MYSFIEKWLADIIGVNYEPFELNSGGSAALIDRVEFDKIKSALTVLWREDNSRDELRPCAINSDVHGIKILFHKYWSNEEVLNGLTDGPTKQTPQIIAFIGEPRFNGESFKERIVNAYNNINDNSNRIAGGGNIGVTIAGDTVTINNRIANGGNIGVPIAGFDAPLGVPYNANEEAIPVNEEQKEEEEVIPVEVHTPTQEELFILYMENDFSIYTTRKNGYTSPEKLKNVMIIGDSVRPDPGLITSLADNLDKNIFVFVDQKRISDFTQIKKKFKFSKISEHSLIILINPSVHNGFEILPDGNNSGLSGSVCLGEEITQLYCLAGSNVKNFIRSDETLTDEEVKEKIDNLENNPTLSVYSKFDEIFKDTCTNIVWALKDRCFIHLTFSISVGKNDKVFEKCITELGKRFGKKISVDEMKQIDREYQNEILEKNKEKYVEFAISSSKEIINEFRTQFEKEKQSYDEHLSKAMEHGKLMQRFADQIEAFDEEEFSSKQKAKALESYQETIKIPGVLSINIKDQIVNVYTKNIYAQDDRTEKFHDIGTFHILIGMMSNSYSQSKTVQIINTKHQINGMHLNMQAPHVFEDGRICHGSLATGMVEAYKKRDLFQLVYQLILFLQDANTDDSAGKYIDKWPEVPKEVANGELSFEEEEYQQPSEVELRFDSMLAEALPIHTTS